VAKLGGLDRARAQESVDVETLAQQLMEVAREVREEFEAQQQKMLPGSSPIEPLTFESDGKDVST
jgi:hypothetical protein